MAAGDDGGRTRTRGDPRGRIPYYRWLLYSSLVLALSLSVLVYLWAMTNFFPNVTVMNLRMPGLGDALADAVPPRSGPRRVVRVLQTRENIACAWERRFDLWRQAERWRDLALAAGFDADFRDERGIPASPRSADLLIVPWVVCLDEGHRLRIEAFARSGGGVIVAGDAAPGTIAVPVGRSRWLVSARGTPPAAALDPGRRLELPASLQARAIQAVGDERPVLFWSHWNLTPLEGPSGAWHAAAAIDTPGRGRRVWFGFPVSHEVESTAGELDRLRALAMLWAAGDAVAALAPWPEGRSHAAVVAVDADGRDPLLDASLQRLERAGIRPTVFMHSRTLDRAPELATALPSGAELGSRGDRRAVFAGEPRVRQGRRLRESRSALRKLTGRPILGLHPPEEQFDDLTLHESAASGYRYLLGDPAFDRAFPRNVLVGGERLALLSRAGVGDALSRPAAPSERRSPAAALSDLERVRRLGGLYLLTVRPGVLRSPRHHQLFERLVDGVTGSDAWLTTAAEASAWAATRQALRLELEESVRGLRIRNQGAEAAPGLVLYVYGRGGPPRRIPVPRLASGSAVTLELAEHPLAVARP